MLVPPPLPTCFVPSGPPPPHQRGYATSFFSTRVSCPCRYAVDDTVADLSADLASVSEQLEAEKQARLDAEEALAQAQEALAEGGEPGEEVDTLQARVQELEDAVTAAQQRLQEALDDATDLRSQLAAASAVAETQQRAASSARQELALAQAAGAQLQVQLQEARHALEAAEASLFLGLVASDSMKCRVYLHAHVPSGAPIASRCCG